MSGFFDSSETSARTLQKPFTRLDLLEILEEI